MVEVALTVGKLDASLALLLTKDHHLIEFPTILLPDDISPGSIVRITCDRDLNREQEEKKEFDQLQDEIFETFGKYEPENPVLKIVNVTQTSCVLEWEPLNLGTSELKELTLYKNGSKLGPIKNPFQKKNIKFSGLPIDTPYKFQLKLETSSGIYYSNLVELKTHKMTDLSGITVCIGDIDFENEPFSLKDIEDAIEAIGAKPYSDEVKVDTTQFICTQDTGIEYQKAKNMNIPIIRPEWLKACQLERRIVGVNKFYLDTESPIWKTRNFWDSSNDVSRSVQVNGHVEVPHIVIDQEESQQKQDQESQNETEHGLHHEHAHEHEPEKVPEKESEQEPEKNVEPLQEPKAEVAELSESAPEIEAEQKEESSKAEEENKENQELSQEKESLNENPEKVNTEEQIQDEASEEALDEKEDNELLQGDLLETPVQGTSEAADEILKSKSNTSNDVLETPAPALINQSSEKPSAKIEEARSLEEPTDLADSAQPVEASVEKLVVEANKQSAVESSDLTDTAPVNEVSFETTTHKAESSENIEPEQVVDNNAADNEQGTVSEPEDFKIEDLEGAEGNAESETGPANEGNNETQANDKKKNKKKKKKGKK